MIQPWNMQQILHEIKCSFGHLCVRHVSWEFAKTSFCTTIRTILWSVWITSWRCGIPIPFMGSWMSLRLFGIEHLLFSNRPNGSVVDNESIKRTLHTLSKRILILKLFWKHENWWYSHHIHFLLDTYSLLFSIWWCNGCIWLAVKQRPNIVGCMCCQSTIWIR